MPFIFILYTPHLLISSFSHFLTSGIIGLFWCYQFYPLSYAS
ncbi:hypothetical protein HMPREF9078_02383 [Capnocytophaga sp. oral taxon 380 str. F0488]|nr:hypothetical protein HMPREF9078_02383 [Capnocytophaga sp. oral taxon 380 str. F0488]